MKSTSSYHHGDLPTALLDAVGEIVREQGAASVTLREAARRAGVSHSAPAHHFGDKDGMIAAYCHQGFDLMSERMARALEASDDDLAAPELISVLGRAYVEFAAENPTHFDVMFRTGIDSIDETSHDDFERHGGMAMLQGLVDDLVSTGLIERGQAEAVSVVLWSVAHGLASLWVDGLISKMFPDITLDLLLDAAFGESHLAFRAVAEPMIRR